MKSCLFFILPVFILLATGCSSDYTPKPHGYFRIDFPQKKYQLYQSACPYEFEYPDYSNVESDQNAGAEPCWINLQFPRFQATLHISYKSINGLSLRRFTEDSRTLAMKHASRAEEIDETPFITSQHVYGLKYDIRGNAASSLQFYLTDSTKHFLRASLYFNVVPAPDSLAPVLAFLNQDIEKFFNSFQWKK